MDTWVGSKRNSQSLLRGTSQEDKVNWTTKGNSRIKTNKTVVKCWINCKNIREIEYRIMRDKQKKERRRKSSKAWKDSAAKEVKAKTEKSGINKGKTITKIKKEEERAEMTRKLRTRIAKRQWSDLRKRQTVKDKRQKKEKIGKDGNRTRNWLLRREGKGRVKWIRNDQSKDGQKEKGEHLGTNWNGRREKRKKQKKGIGRNNFRKRNEKGKKNISKGRGIRMALKLKIHNGSRKEEDENGNLKGNKVAGERNK